MKPAGLAGLLMLVLCSCQTSGEVEGTVKDGINGSGTGTPASPTNSWSFAAASDYSYDSDYLNFSAGNVSLRSVASSFTDASSFHRGTQAGLSFQSGKLSIQTTFGQELSGDWAPDGLAANWHMNGSLADAGGNGLHLTGTGGVTFTASGKLGSHAATFAGGVNDQASVTLPAVTGSTGGAYCAWIKTAFTWGVDGGSNGAGGRGDALVFARNVPDREGTLLLIGTNGGMRFFTADATGFTATSTVAASTIKSGTWTHVCAVFRHEAGALNEVYVNGIQKASAANTRSWAFGSDVFHIGDSSNTYWEEFGGEMDEISVFSRPLSAGEVTSLYFRQAQSYGNELSPVWAPKFPYLVGYWKMDNNWLDSSGNSGNGTATNAPTFSASARVGSHGGAFDDDTAYQYVTIPNSTALQDVQESAYTVQAWYRPNSVPNATVNRNQEHAILVKSSPGTGITYGYNQFYFRNWGVGYVQKLTASPQAYYPGGWYHVVGVYDTANGLARLYVNGEQVGTVSIAGLTPFETGTASWRLGAADTSTADADYGYFADGTIDEAAIWNKALTAGEVKQIYHRQKQKYAGSYDSPVIDLGASGAWSSLASVSPLPFHKEIPLAAEGTGAYADIFTGTSLHTGLQALYRFNDSSYPAPSTLPDASGNNAYADISTAVPVGEGVFGRAGNLNYNNLWVGAARLPNMSNTMSFQAWIKTTDATVWRQFAYRNDTVTTYGWKLMTYNATGTLVVRLDTSGAANQTNCRGTKNVTDGQWHHVVMLLDSGQCRIYVDGKLDADVAYVAGTGFSTAAPLSLGNSINAWFDETALWGRVLDPTEILQLYRRGANRVKYQVKSCGESTCACQAVLTGGSTSDCSNDGTANDLAGTDANQANWIGPDGTAATYFSEIQNNAAVDASGNPTGAVQTSGLALDWSGAFFTAAARPANNRYFQYRVYAESDDENSLCGSAPCMPELTSVAVGPTGRYYGGSPTIINNTSLTYSQLATLAKSDTNACTKYQLSTDNGANWKYWNGSAWATTANGVADANFLSDFSGRLSSLPAGQLKFKAFLTTNTGGSFLDSCSLQSVTATFEP